MPIKYKKVNAKDGKEVLWERIVKVYEYMPGQYVTLSKEEIKAANPKAYQAIEIQDFVKFADIDLMFFERPYYLAPQRNGVKGYFLLLEALKRSHKVAVAKIVIRAKQHLAVIMATDEFLILELMRFAHDVDYLQNVEALKFNAKEIKMAEDLIEGMTAEWRPEKYKDNYEDDLMRIINKRIKAGEG